MRLILGSKSARRRELLEMTGLDFDIMVSDEPEDESPIDLSGVEFVGEAPDSVALKVSNIALRKALCVRDRVRRECLRDRVILGADTVVALGEELIGKPRDLADAKAILTKLSGRMHEVVTAYVICEGDGERILLRPTVSRVYFRELAEWEIDEYVANREVLDKAGAYGIQDRAALFVEKIEGDFYNIVGLPVCWLRADLARFGVTL